MHKLYDKFVIRVYLIYSIKIENLNNLKIKYYFILKCIIQDMKTY